MKLVLQRVSTASVWVDSRQLASIGKGFLLLVGVLKGDSEIDAELLAKKLSHLRVFEDENGKMKFSLSDVGGEILLVSNFTLGADCKKGRRPSFDSAASPQEARRLYQYLADLLVQAQFAVSMGEFGAHMQVCMQGDGPVTLCLDSSDLRPI